MILIYTCAFTIIDLLMCNFLKFQNLAFVEAFIDFDETDNIEDFILKKVEINLKTLAKEIEVLKKKLFYQINSTVTKYYIYSSIY